MRPTEWAGAFTFGPMNVMIRENVKLAFRSIRANILRTALTLMIIMVGIMALVGILTSTESIKTSMVENFRVMGSNTFVLRNEGGVRQRGGPRKRKAENPVITLNQSRTFKERYRFPSVVSIASRADDAAVIRYRNKKTNPNVRVFGIDEHYLAVSGQTIAEGRNISRIEAEQGTDVILLGKDVRNRIFGRYDSVINQSVAIGSKKFRVIGILGSKGASQVSTDNQVMIPLMSARRNLPEPDQNHTINVMVSDPEEINLAVEEATGIFRGVRGLRSSQEINFDISKSDRLSEQIIEQLSYVKYATIVIGLLTLLGAGIGLMNIMLVSVNERTREIGISKALGASKRAIRMQFLTESITICMLGGILGIVLGVLMGNLVGMFLNAGFIMPWGWVIGGLVFTFIVGLGAGLYPAIMASELDPVEALRYE